MPDTFQIAFQAPIIESIQGKSVEFPVLDIDDLSPWCAKIKAEQTAEGLKRVPANMPPFDRWRAEEYLRNNEPSLDDLVPRVTTIPGGKMVLDLSLSKSGRKDVAERRAIISAVPPYRFAQLARDVSGLFPPLTPWLTLPASDAPAEGSGPNPAAGESAGEPTGSASNP